MNIDTLTGLEVIQGIASGDIPHPPMAETIPMKFTSAEAGSVVFEVTADDRHTNPMGGVHGGFAATVLDSVTGCAVHTMLEAGRGYGTIELNVKMLKPVPKNTVLRAEGKVLSLSKSLGVSEGKLFDAEGRLLAYGSATCMLMRPKT
jgi:uncharacterized protein (TIGR00369 family)